MMIFRAISMFGCALQCSNFGLPGVVTHEAGAVCLRVPGGSSGAEEVRAVDVNRREHYYLVAKKNENGGFRKELIPSLPQSGISRPQLTGSGGPDQEDEALVETIRSMVGNESGFAVNQTTGAYYWTAQQQAISGKFYMPPLSEDDGTPDESIQIIGGVFEGIENEMRHDGPIAEQNRGIYNRLVNQDTRPGHQDKRLSENQVEWLWKTWLPGMVPVGGTPVDGDLVAVEFGRRGGVSFDDDGIVEAPEAKNLTDADFTAEQTQQQLSIEAQQQQVSRPWEIYRSGATVFDVQEHRSQLNTPVRCGDVHFVNGDAVRMAKDDDLTSAAQEAQDSAVDQKCSAGCTVQ